MDWNMNLSKNLKRILSERDLTVAQLSRKARVPRTTISEWMTGGNPRDLRKVKFVADALNLTVDQLCFGDGTAGTESIENHLEEIKAGLFEVVLRRPKRMPGIS